jgi:hypothetical protein
VRAPRRSSMRFKVRFLERNVLFPYDVPKVRPCCFEVRFRDVVFWGDGIFDGNGGRGEVWFGTGLAPVIAYACGAKKYCAWWSICATRNGRSKLYYSTCIRAGILLNIVPKNLPCAVLCCRLAASCNPAFSFCTLVFTLSKSCMLKGVLCSFFPGPLAYLRCEHSDEGAMRCAERGPP